MTNQFGSFSFGTTTQSKPKTTDPLMIRLQSISDSYDKNSQSYKFQSVFFDSKSTTSFGGSSTKPACVTPDDWAKINASIPDPDHQSPSVLCGFSSLNERFEKQHEVVNKMKSKLKDLEIRILELKQDSSDICQKKFKKISDNFNKISTILLEYMLNEEVNSLKSYPFSTQEQALLDRLTKLQQDMKRPDKYDAQLNALNQKAKLMKESMAVPPAPILSEELLQQSIQALSQHNIAISELSNVIKKMEQSVNQMQKQLHSSTA